LTDLRAKVGTGIEDWGLQSTGAMGKKSQEVDDDE